MNDSPAEDDHVAFGPVTPWERSTFSRLNQRSESEPSVPTHIKGHPDRSVSLKAPRPSRRSATQGSVGARHRASPPPENAIRRQQVLGSLSANASPMPYETSFASHSTTPANPSPPPCYTKAIPNTPPESLKDRSVSSTEKSDSASPKQKFHVLPGTMSARNGRSKASSKQRSERRKSKPAKAGSWKVVFRQIFTKTPVDESQFERIEDRHWTDD